MTLLLAATAWQLPPAAILLIGIVTVVVAVSVLRIHPFFSLLLAAILVGILSPELPGDDTISHWINAVETPMRELGATAASIAFVIALAAVIGVCLTESGAADKIVLRLVAVLGEQRAALALMLSGFILSIPVFFDTMFFLLIPLARALARRVGRHYVLFVMAVAGGGVITHSLVPPTPGPLVMADRLGLELGTAIWVGSLVGLAPAFLTLIVGRWMDRAFPVSLVDEPSQKEMASFSESGLPPLTLSLLPVIVPVALVGAVSVLNVVFADAIASGQALPVYFHVLAFVGNKNIALLLGTVAAVWLVIRRIGFDRRHIENIVGEAMQMAGVIILITAAGGAFGAMIRHCGIAETIATLATDGSVPYVFLAWGVAAVFKIAQGSGTVSMITTSSIMAGVATSGALGFHPVYLYLAIGFGSLFGSWMNDSGFWIVGRMSGFTEQQTLRTWTVLLAIISVTGLLITWLLAVLLPLPQP